ncbi:PTS system, Lactose/Cellobiose specific IIB subunit [Spiroplasma clarkii]|uniref:hypothetical protein n=1 Tax=Spiroplasma clarkii TaxID=2139 RepID=UPI000B580660|nr:hypothetical protein [Spiroplasma clarkii]ARU92138.1 PTS system, Lactose/Cellobiose specific IIB subunit [Spiroplasma clarkii]
MKKEKNQDNLKLKADVDKSLIIDKAKNSKVVWKKYIQKAGSFMAGMIMPTVGILIAWGLLAAAFLGKMENDVWVKTGWITFEPMGVLIAPMMKWLIPVLIGYTAGHMIYGARGAMIGATFTFAAIVGNDFIYANYAADWRMGADIVKNVAAPNQIVGAMVVAPLLTFMVKKIESYYINRIKPGYEMLVRNFSQAGLVILGIFLVFFTWGFIMYGISFVMVEIIELFTRAPWAFPFMAIFTEPLRAIFLNNALNWGVMIPLGLQEVEMSSKGFSAFFMVGGILDLDLDY